MKRPGLSRSARRSAVLLAAIVVSAAAVAGAAFAAGLPDSTLPQATSLYLVSAPPPGAARDLLARDVLVLRDMERYLLVAATPAQVAALGAAPAGETSLADLDWTLIDAVTAGRTYYTVMPPDRARLAELGCRVLFADRWDAVVEASPELADHVSREGFEIARVFARPVRPAREERPRPSAGPNAAADPFIAELVGSVSGTNIDSQVQRLQDFRTRYARSDSCQAAANWIKARFESFGIDSVYFHHWDPQYKDNVVAVIPGAADPSRMVVIGGHYDSTSPITTNCPGADDDGSGTSGVLECARVLAGHPFNYTLVFIAFCAEEQGLLGSEAYAGEAAARGDDIMAMIEMDMIGYKASGDVLDLDLVDNASSVWIRDLVMNAAATYVPGFSVVDGAIPGGASSDHASFWGNGYDALLFFEDSDQYSPYIHTTSDVVGTSYNNPTLALSSVKVAVASLAMLAEPFSIAIRHTPLPDTEDTTHPYPVTAQVVAAGALQAETMQVQYSTQTGSGSAPLLPTGNPDEFEGLIPAMPGGSWVDYYLEAGDDQGHFTVDPPGAPDETYRFFVGAITTVASDDFEAASGWTVGAPDDGATTGIWTRADPYGTWSGSTPVQPEDDHTPAPGVACWVTGNAGPGAAQGDDDVDNGKTTLTSPVYDLSGLASARLRYYRWYTNTTGSDPGSDEWRVEVSANDGASWTAIEATTSSARAWTLIERNLEEVIPLTAQVRVRFIASDYSPGSIVEAAVDDLEIQTFQSLATSVAERGAGGAARIRLAQNMPNPARAGTVIGFTVEGAPRAATLRIFDVAGREVATLLRGEPVTGTGSVRWNGRDAEGRQAPAGVYFYRLETERESITRKMIVVQ